MVAAEPNVSEPAILDSTQVLVIGGGPAGATCSTLMAQHGLQVTLLERETFPRFHIGESLIPETYWVLQRLNMLPKLEKSHFIRKESVQFVGATGRLSEPFYFTQHKPGDQSRTWQVLRSEFDQMMLDNAREHGVSVYEGTRVLDVLFEGDKAVGARIIAPDGEVKEIRAQVVVDASGQSSMIANKFKLRVIDEKLKKAAVWTYWKGAYRDQGIDEGATIVLQTKDKNGWFWYIPLHNDVISIGIVADCEYLMKGRGDHESIYWEQVANCPAIGERISKAERCATYYATKDYTYRSKKVAGDGWVLVGDAFGFLDPLYSSGVLLALHSGMMAADAVADAFKKNDLSAAQLGCWEKKYVKGMERMRRLVCEYYDGFSFGRFVKQYPQFKGHITDLLIGDLFEDDIDEVMGPLDNARAEIDAARAAKAKQAVGA
ncbi:MAG: NAD(P)/FAD-dependent oxidoreductase [Pirellulales bacterium]